MITSIIEKYEANPEQSLYEIQKWFHMLGYEFRRGLITEEEFYSLTFYDLNYIKLWGLKNNIYVDRKNIENCVDFLPSWDYWKNTGRMKNSAWLYSCISQAGNLLQSGEWVFKVMDALKIPPQTFVGIPEDALPVLPNIFIVYDTSKENVIMFLGKSTHHYVQSPLEPDMHY